MMDGFSTKQKGDVAEYRVISELLQRGVPVLKPLGDRMPYDLAVDPMAVKEEASPEEETDRDFSLEEVMHALEDESDEHSER